MPNKLKMLPGGRAMIIGIDIGVTGAIALLDETGALLEISDIPTLQDGPKGRREVNAPPSPRSSSQAMRCPRSEKSRKLPQNRHPKVKSTPNKIHPNPLLQQAYQLHLRRLTGRQ